MYIKKYFLICSFLAILNGSVFGQLPSTLFSRIELRLDTAMFTSTSNLIQYNGEDQLYFIFETENPVCEVRVYPYEEDLYPRLRLLRSHDFDIVDSLVNFNNQYYRFKVRFRNLYTTDFLNFTFMVYGDDTAQPTMEVIPLLPVTNTTVEFIPDDNELFIGEEKVYPLITNNFSNIRADNLWTSGNMINYRIAETNGQLNIHLISQTYGFQMLELSIRTKKPFINEYGILSYELPVIHEEFMVRRSRLRFLRVDWDYVIHDPQNLAGYEIQMEYNPTINAGRTYRIENQEEAGGALIAELFVKSHIDNDRMLCVLRPYHLHRTNEGYLYIKDNDQSVFITNFNIIPKPQIKSIQILREGGDWTSNLSVHPGETIELRIEGESLHKANFEFEGVTNITLDTLIHNEYTATYVVKVPVDIYSRSIPIYNNGEKTGFGLNIQEFHRPRQFDFIIIEGSGFLRQFNKLGSTIMTSEVLRNLSIVFDPDLIDSDGELYGQQQLNITVTIRGRDNELVEIKEFEDITICPGSFSPRNGYYSGNCSADVINVNNYLTKKTYDIESWSKITIEIEHDKNAYGGKGNRKSIDIIYEKYLRFDIDVSFPAGLLTFGGKTSGNLTGISMAMIAQLSFYDRNRINRLRPYKVGAGFIALDAFNFSENDDNRDVAFVILGSLYPTRKDKKLTFPLYFGGGYKLKTQEFFFLIGPGIRISL